MYFWKEGPGRWWQKRIFCGLITRNDIPLIIIVAILLFWVGNMDGDFILGLRK